MEKSDQVAIGLGHGLADKVIARRRAQLEGHATTPRARGFMGLAGFSSAAPSGSTSMTLEGPTRRSSLVLAMGDSWFAYWPHGDVLDLLERRHQYEVDSKAKGGVTLKAMTQPDNQLSWLLRRISDLPDQRKDELTAVLLSGGGNDVVGDRQVLMSLLQQSHPQQPLDEAQMRQVVDVELRGLLIQVLVAITEVCRVQLQRLVPIVVHGYDYPVPDGRPASPMFGPWLQPVLMQRGYHDLATGKSIMRTLIDRLNEMQQSVAALAEFQHVVYVDLRKSLSTEQSNYQTFWLNELHPTQEVGFQIIADRIAERLL